MKDCVIHASLDSSSGTLSKIGYLPYGKSGGASGPFGYTGQRIDPETNGLYYYRARHYSPAWGRFLQADPIGYGGGVNLYAYVTNDPLNFTDPNGLVKDAAVTAFTHSADAELAQSQAVTDFAQQYPRTSAIVGTIGIGIPLGIAGAGAIGAIGAGALDIGATATVTVGRVMSTAELEAMQSTGLVQESISRGITSVTIPPNPSLYRAGPASDIFVQFDVPQTAISAFGRGIGKIYGPNSMFGPARGITSMPPATNIVVP